MPNEFMFKVNNEIASAFERTNGHAARIIYNGALVRFNLSPADLKLGTDSNKKRYFVFVERVQRGSEQKLVRYSVMAKKPGSKTASLLKVPCPFSKSSGSLQCLSDSYGLYPELQHINELLNKVASMYYNVTVRYEPELNLIYIESPVYLLMKDWTRARGFGLTVDHIRFLSTDSAKLLIENFRLVASLFLVSTAENLSMFAKEFLYPKINLMRNSDPLFSKLVTSRTNPLIFLGFSDYGGMYNPLTSFGADSSCSTADSLVKGLIGTKLELDSKGGYVFSLPLKNYKMYWCTSASLCKALSIPVKFQWSQAYALLYLYDKLASNSLVHAYDAEHDNISDLISTKYALDYVWSSVLNKSIFTQNDVRQLLDNAELADLFE